MGKTLLEHLSGERPAGRPTKIKNTNLDLVRDWVRRHEDELIEAVARGYSWKQIDAACGKVWSSNEVMSRIVRWKNGELLHHCWYELKKHPEKEDTPLRYPKR